MASLTAKASKTGFKHIAISGFIEFPDQTASWEMWELMPFAGIGVTMGLLGAHFCWCVRHMQQLRMRVFLLGQKGKVRRWARVAETLAVTSISMLVTYYVVISVPCTPIPQANSTVAGEKVHPLLLYSSSCANPEQESSGVGTILFESREFAIKALFSEGFANGGIATSHLAMLAVLIYVFTLLTYGLSIPAGLFIPNIMVGACVGRFLGQILNDNLYEVHPGVYALVGAAGMLAGFSRMTVSLAVIVLEITTNMRLVLPLMLVIMLAKVVGDQFTPSAYDIIIALKNIPMLEPETETQEWRDLMKIPIVSVGTPADQLEVVPVQQPFRVVDALDKLISTRHHAWPVVENLDNMRLLGLLSRERLLDCFEARHPLPKANGALQNLCLDDLDVDEELNILEYVDRYPFLMAHRTPVRQAYRTFRSLGLRHLSVVDERHSILALVTRTDLCEVVEDYCHASKQAMRDFAERQNPATELDELLHGGRARADTGGDKYGEQDIRQLVRTISNGVVNKTTSLDGEVVRSISELSHQLDGRRQSQIGSTPMPAAAATPSFLERITNSVTQHSCRWSWDTDKRPLRRQQRNVAMANFSNCLRPARGSAAPDEDSFIPATHSDAQPYSNNWQQATVVGMQGSSSSASSSKVARRKKGCCLFV